MEIHEKCIKYALLEGETMIFVWRKFDKGQTMFHVGRVESTMKFLIFWRFLARLIPS